ncbi:MAG: formylglycine-generating enzyme family protein [Planctomycetaceae bacterium]
MKRHSLLLAAILSIVVMLTHRICFAHDETTSDNAAGNCSIAVRPRWSDRRITVTSQDGTVLQLGRSFDYLREVGMDFPLTLRDYQMLLYLNEKSRLLERRVDIDLRDVPVLEGAARIAKTLRRDVVPSRQPGLLEIAEAIADSPLRYWTTVGPMLLVARVSTVPNSDPGKSWRLVISPEYFAGEIHQTEIQLYDVEVLTTSGEVASVNVGRATSGVWIGELPVSPKELTGLRGKVRAIVAKDRLQIRFRPGESCRISDPFGVEIQSEPVQQTKELRIVADGERSVARPKDQNGFVYHTTLTVVGNDAAPASQYITLLDVAALPGSVDDGRIAELVKLTKERNFFKFMGNLNKTPSERMVAAVKSTNGAEFAGRANGKALTTDTGVSILLYGENIDQVETMHEVTLCRLDVLQDMFQIKIEQAQTDVYEPWERLTLEQSEPPPRSTTEPDMTNSLGMRLALIPAGKFVMGADQSPMEVARNQSYEGIRSVPSNYFAENPPHVVEISKPFYLGVCEVTQSEWRAVTGKNPSGYQLTGWRRVIATSDRFPVENVSWYDAVEFCNRLSEKEKHNPYYKLENVRRTDGWITYADVTITGGTGYRLPTEAEWEYACRAGTTTAFNFGNTCSQQQANVLGGYPAVKPDSRTWNPIRTTKSVGSFEPNAFGLYDMHGNVEEWCFDIYDDAAYLNRDELAIDPVVLQQAEESIQFFAEPVDDEYYNDIVWIGDERVIRGGHSSRGAGVGRSANRFGADPNSRWMTGLRVAKDQ